MHQTKEHLWTKEPHWACPHCKTVNMPIREICRSCGYDTNAGEFPHYNPLPPYQGLIQKLFIAFILFTAATLAHAQTLIITGPALTAICPGTAVWTSSNDSAMATAPYPSLIYRGTPFTCTLPFNTTGMVAVSIIMEEPNKTAANQRRFAIAVNGPQSAPLDLFALTGGKLLAYEYDPPPFYFSGQFPIAVSFTPTLGNAVVSAITITPLPPPPSPSPASFIPRSWEELKAMATTVSYTLGGQPIADTELDIYRNGLHFSSGIDYTIVGQVVTFISNGQPQMGDVVDFLYRTQIPTVACLSATPPIVQAGQ